MAAMWVIRTRRVFRPPQCRVCGGATEGGLVCDECGLRLLEQTRDKARIVHGPPHA